MLGVFRFPAEAENRELRIVYARNYAPFSWQGEGGKVEGILIDMLEEVLGRRMGIALSHEVFPWARSQRMVAEGERDAFFTIPNARRAEYGHLAVKRIV